MSSVENAEAFKPPLGFNKEREPAVGGLFTYTCTSEYPVTPEEVVAVNLKVYVLPALHEVFVCIVMLSDVTELSAVREVTKTTGVVPSGLSMDQR